MSNELKALSEINNTIYFNLFDQNGEVYNIITTEVENYVGTSSVNYAISGTDTLSNGYYTGNFPVAITTPGIYPYNARIQSGLVPTQMDTIVAAGYVSWNGVEEVINASGSNLITLAYLKSNLNVNTTKNDAYYMGLILAASRVIRNYTNNNFNNQMYNEVLDGNNDFCIQVKNTPITSLLNVTIDVYGSNPISIDPSNFIVDAGKGTIRYKPSSNLRTTWFPVSNQNIQIDYMAGYSDTPEDIKLVCAEMCRILQFQRGTNLLTTSVKWGDFSATYALMQRIIDEKFGLISVLDYYRRWF